MLEINKTFVNVYQLKERNEASMFLCFDVVVFEYILIEQV